MSKQKKYIVVYKITNNINNKEYIGVHRTNKTDDSYMGSGKLILRAIKNMVSKFLKNHSIYF